jgi:uncharacterized membrane protein YkoI
MTKLPRDIRKKFDTRQSQISNTFKAELKKKLFQEEFMAKKNIQPKTSFLKRVNPGPVIAVLIMVIFVGASSAAVTTSRANNAREAEIEIPKDLTAVLSVDDIRAVALTEVPDGTIVGVELEQDDGVLIYKVKFSDGSFKLYNANTGEIVNKDQLEVDESVPAGFVAAISMQEARTIAQNQQPTKTITKIELEVENGVVVYSVRFSDDSLVEVNATDGSIVKIKTSNDVNGNSSDDDSTNESQESESDDNSSNNSPNSDQSNDDNSDGTNSSSDSDSGTTDNGDSTSNSGRNHGSNNNNIED